ncbi:polyprenyl synthetase family protein [Microbacterium sp. ARD32]|uniref:polyprenyl synthetase family protein n=1 Tax=Microbacterium sp. ARD32 TaxID=2962577 RepID=UPI0028819B60|nr:polyprenyl synthetase family protein [Microbacterium sp. ARD32]MDT0157543.1 polyprenyl synthetase family protein [Microbacterium sp. ARD32]
MLPSSITDAVTARLDAFVAQRQADAGDYGPDAALFLRAAGSTLAGGKRLRARFCHAGWTAAAPRAVAGTPALWGLCASLEIFQSAALVHDDLIDNSDTRRGLPAAHRALGAAHRAAGWHGDAEAFGRSAAVLLGDLLVAWSDDLLEEALQQHPHAAATRAEYARMRRDVTVGQMLDIAEESAWSVSEPSTLLERALRVASLKSARYSVVEPLLLGATLAGADSALRASLRDFGHPIGMAFQLRDDLLGVFGDPAVTGKPAGDDLREGKRTALIAVARERLPAAQRAELDAALGDASLPAPAVAELQRLIRSTGAPRRIEEMIEDFTAQAERALIAAGIDEQAAAALRALADAAIARSA